ncbi:MAG: tetratricopeptide repeat protein [Pyrinomonadaceae bacterium]
MSVKSFQINSIAQRAGLIIIGLCCLIFLFFALQWYFGNSIATRAAYKEVAEFANDLAPDDPQVHYALAVLNEKTFLPDDLQKSLAEYEQATALAPNDYRVWLALGKARERTGDAAGAELALKKSLELAPNYAQVQWTLGNILLRRGKTQEAFAELRKAAESDVKYAVPTVLTAAQFFDGDLAQIRQNIGSSSQINFALTTFLANQKRFDEALEIWNSLPSEEKKTVFKKSGEQFFREMLNVGKYRNALQIQKQISESGAEFAALEKVSNGGFEADVKATKSGIFEWQIADGTKPQIGFDDAQKHDGTRSLVIIFNSLDGKEFRQVSQMIAVEANKKYVFEFFYKSALKASSTLKWEVVNVSDGKILAATSAIPNDADWTNLKTEFTTLEDTEAVTLRLARDNCQSSICPIAGKVWFDGFDLVSR